MKKSFPANINGKIFYIDEDAYNLLLDYLSQLRATFTGPEGDEIVSDIEQRIAEHFDERILLGYNVIVLTDVNRVIEIMGRPDQLSDQADDFRADTTDTDSSSSPSSSTGTNGPATPPEPPHTAGSSAATSSATPPPPPLRKRLYRDARHKIFGGVIAGLGQYLGWDVTMMRILAVVLAVCTTVWPCVIIYMIAWMIIPVARTPRQILEMQGQPVTLDNIGQTVLNNSTPPAAPVPDENISTFSTGINTFFSIAAKFILGFVALVSGVTAFVMTCLILVIIAGIIYYSVTGSAGILEPLNFIDSSAVITQASGYACLFFSILIPFILIARYAAAPVLRTRTPSTATLVTAIIFELLFITATVTLLSIAVHNSAGSDFDITYTAVTIISPDRLLSTLPLGASLPLGALILAPAISA